MNLLEGKRLKSSLKELEEILAESSVIFSTWRTSTFYQVNINRDNKTDSVWIKSLPPPFLPLRKTNTLPPFSLIT